MSATYDASNVKDVRRAEKAADLADLNDREVTATLMSTKPGRAWVLRRLERAHVFANSFTGEWGSTAFKCGEHNLGLQLLADVMSVAPDNFILMMKEREHTDAARRSASERSRSQNSNGGVDRSIEPSEDGAGIEDGAAA